MINIKFKNRGFILIGDLTDGAITTEYSYKNSEPSYAHLYKDGRILRNGIQVGTKEDIEIISNDYHKSS